MGHGHNKRVSILPPLYRMGGLPALRRAARSAALPGRKALTIPPVPELLTALPPGQGSGSG